MAQPSSRRIWLSFDSGNARRTTNASPPAAPLKPPRTAKLIPWRIAPVGDITPTPPLPHSHSVHLDRAPPPPHSFQISRWRRGPPSRAPSQRPPRPRLSHVAPTTPPTTSTPIAVTTTAGASPSLLPPPRTVAIGDARFLQATISFIAPADQPFFPTPHRGRVRGAAAELKMILPPAFVDLPVESILVFNRQLHGDIEAAA